MLRRGFIAATAWPCALARAQGATRRVARVGYLGWSADSSGAPQLPLAALREGLAAQGWREGETLHIEPRQGEREQAAALTAELVRAGADVIVAIGPMVFGSRGSAGTVPIVFTINGDPAQAGLVASLARPGGQLTGLSALNTELSSKRVELLKALRPGLHRVAALANSVHPGVQAELAATQAATAQLGLTMKYYPVVQASEFAAAFEAIARDDAQALVAFPDTLVNRQARAVADFARARRIAAVSGWREFAEAGNVMSLGPVPREYYRRVAAYVDKLLKGAKAADLPVEQPTRVELVLNRRAAAGIGLELPSALQLRADEVIG